MRDKSRRLPSTGSLREILLPSPRSAMRGSTEVISGVVRRTNDRMRRLARAHVPDPRVARHTDERARFRAALQVAGRSEADLPEIERGAGRRFEMLAILAMFALAWLFIGPAVGLGMSSGWRFADLAFPVGFAAWMLSLAFSSAVTLHRVQQRRMVTIREFLRTPEAWWGGPPSRGATMCLAALAAGAGLSALMPYAALAQGIAGATASTSSTIAQVLTNGGAEDLSLEWLRKLFPGMASLACPSGGTCPDTGGDVLQAMMGAFNSILFGLGAAMLTFQTIVGTANTAHEGKVMGERWHTLWAPIRVAVGVGSLVPMNGYAAIQYAMMLMIVLGYNMANSVWSAYVGQFYSGAMAPAAVIGSQSMGLSLANAVMINETCAAVLRGHAAGVQAAAGGSGTVTQGPPRRGSIQGTLAQSAAVSPGGGGVPPFGPAIAALNVPPPAPSGNAASDGSRTWDWGAACGSLRTAPPSDPLASWSPNSQAQGQAWGSTQANQVQQQRSLTERSVEQANAAYRNFLQTRDQALSQLIAAVQQANVHGYIASAVVSNLAAAGGVGNAPTADQMQDEVVARYNRIVQAGAAFDQSVNAAARTMVQAINAQGADQITERARALGWASAGALNTALVRAMARSIELTGSAAPAVRGPDPSQLSTALGQGAQTQVGQRLAAGMELARRVVGNLNPAVTAAYGSGPPQVQAGADMQSRNLIAQLLKPISEGMTRFVTDDVGYIDPVRPMASIQNFGNLMLSIGQGMVVGWVAANMGGEATATSALGLVGGGAARGAVDGIAALYIPVMIATLICGALHAYILPMLVFLIWFYAIIAVVSVAAELIIAAPVAAFMHVRMDGSELINGEQRPIYLMIFNALLRPSLLLFGLATANLAFSVLANFLNKTYGMAVSVTNGDSVVGVVGWITLTILVFYIHYQLVTRCMHLITAVPAVVAELVGARDQSRDEQENTRQVFAAVTNISSRAGVGMQNAMAASVKGKQEGGHASNATTAPAETAIKPTRAVAGPQTNDK